MQRKSLLSASLVWLFTAGCGDGAVQPNIPTEGTTDHSQFNPELGYINGEERQGYIRGPDGSPMLVSYIVHGEWGFIQGDMGVPLAAIANSRSELETGLTTQGVVIRSQSYRWPSGEVPYQIAPGFQNPSVISAALSQIEAQMASDLGAAIVDFVPRTTQSSYVEFVANTDSVCASYGVGRVGGKQTITLHENVCSTGNIMHEALHALGSFHEQSRCDRDSYVDVIYSNIDPDYYSQFDKHCTDAIDIASYELQSIMHYGPYAFCKYPCPGQTIVAHSGPFTRQRDSLAITDRHAIAYMFPFPVSIDGPQYTYGSGTYTWTADHSSSFAPYGYTWWRREDGESQWEVLGGTNTLNLYVDNCSPSFTLMVWPEGYGGAHYIYKGQQAQKWVQVIQQQTPPCPGDGGMG